MTEHWKKKDYERQIDNFIPLAERYADQSHPGINQQSSDGLKAEWNQVFAGEMNRLTKAAYLRIDVSLDNRSVRIV